MKKKLLGFSLIAVVSAVMTVFSYAACDHNWRLDYTQSVASTCVEKGKNVYVCSRCSETKTEAIDVIEHDFVKVSGEYATCENEGTVVEKCSICQKERKDTTKATGHDYGNAVITKKPTTKRVGNEELTCSRCGDISVREIPMLDKAEIDTTLILIVGGVLIAAAVVIIVILLLKKSKSRK